MSKEKNIVLTCKDQKVKLLINKSFSDFIIEKGGVLTVFYGYGVKGWWSSFKGTIGRIGNPIKDGEYIEFKNKGITLYMDENILNKIDEKGGTVKFILGNQEFVIYVE